MKLVSYQGNRTQKITMSNSCKALCAAYQVLLYQGTVECRWELHVYHPLLHYVKVICTSVARHRLIVRVTRVRIPSWCKALFSLTLATAVLQKEHKTIKLKVKCYSWLNSSNNHNFALTDPMFKILIWIRTVNPSSCRVTLRFITKQLFQAITILIKT